MVTSQQTLKSDNSQHLARSLSCFPRAQSMTCRPKSPNRSDEMGTLNSTGVSHCSLSNGYNWWCTLYTHTHTSDHMAIWIYQISGVSPQPHPSHLRDACFHIIWLQKQAEACETGTTLTGAAWGPENHWESIFFMEK